jgi:hypothetical protein
VPLRPLYGCSRLADDRAVLGGESVSAACLVYEQLLEISSKSTSASARLGGIVKTDYTLDFQL